MQIYMKFIKGIPKISISSACRRSFLPISVKVRDGVERIQKVRTGNLASGEPR